MPKTGWGRVSSARPQVLPDYAPSARLTWPNSIGARAARRGSDLLCVFRLTGDRPGVSLWFAGQSDLSGAVASPYVAGVSSATGVLQGGDETRRGVR